MLHGETSVDDDDDEAEGVGELVADTGALSLRDKDGGSGAIAPLLGGGSDVHFHRADLLDHLRMNGNADDRADDTASDRAMVGGWSSVVGASSAAGSVEDDGDGDLRSTLSGGGGGVALVGGGGDAFSLEVLYLFSLYHVTEYFTNLMQQINE